MGPRRTAAILGVISATLAATLSSGASAQEDFYRGKTVTVVIGSKSGTLSLAAQLVGRHIGRHIPGAPTSVTQQMPGGAHLVATNYAYNVAAADGLTILAVNPQVAVAQLTKVPAVRFDIRRFEWLGSSGSDGVIFGIRADLPHRSFKDLQTSERELVVGATGPGSNSYDFPLLLREFAGAKLKIVAGYASNTDVMLAIERKEVDGWTALGATVKLAEQRGSVRPIARARTPVSGLNHLPVDEELTNDPLGKSLMAIRGIPLTIGRAFGVRPGTPPERVKILREALARAMADPQLKAEAKAAAFEVEHIAAGEVIKGFGELMSQPPSVIEQMGKYIKAGQ